MSFSVAARSRTWRFRHLPSVKPTQRRRSPSYVTLKLGVPTELCCVPVLRLGCLAASVSRNWTSKRIWRVQVCAVVDADPETVHQLATEPTGHARQRKSGK